MTNAEYAREYMTEEEIDRSLEDLFREFGLLPKWEARAEAEGEARGRTEIAKNMLNNGFSEEQTAKLSGLDIIEVKALSEAL